MLRRMPLARFGTFELDDEKRELRRQGRLVHLTGQPFMALELLVRRAGAIVTREDLRQHIWGESRFVDFDRNLNFCIATIRTALGDRARSPRFIETIPRRGYRFIADVQGTEARGWRARWWALAAVIPVLLMQGVSATRAHTRVTTTPAALSAFERGMADYADGIEGRRRSIYRFREATRLDPRFAEAHYALADAYLDLAGARALAPAAALAEARDEALRALALEDVPETRIVLGVVRLVRDRDWNGARHEHVRSLAAEPNSDRALTAYARYLSAAGDNAGAIAAIDRAEAISPSCDLVLWESALIHYRARRGDDALEKVRLAAKYGPPGGVDADEWTVRTQWLALLIHAQQHRWPLALADADAIAAVWRIRRPSDASGQDVRGSVLAFVRRSADWASTQPAASRRPVWVATLYAVAGNDETALTWLERAVEERDTEILFGLRNPEFDGVRQRDRFRRLLPT
jgi:DNA-binding winged helix-turn-helix (wHTH) protein/tetratricopeptide (TPR) repeat protein